MQHTSVCRTGNYAQQCLSVVARSTDARMLHLGSFNFITLDPLNPRRIREHLNVRWSEPVILPRWVPTATRDRSRSNPAASSHPRAIEKSRISSAELACLLDEQFLLFLKADDLMSLDP